MDTNLISFIGTFAPAAVYAFVVYLTMPRKTVEISHAPLFFCGGVLAVIGVLLLHFVFPFMSGSIADNVPSMLIQNFFQVGFVEELFKFVMFMAAVRYFAPSSVRSNVFMYMCLGAGFAAAENFGYLQRAIGYATVNGLDSSVAMTVLTVRTFSATILHMAVAALVGKLWGDGKPLLGLGFAVFIHGTYNSVIELSESEVSGFLMAGICLLIAFLVCSDLLDKDFFKVLDPPHKKKGAQVSNPDPD